MNNEWRIKTILSVEGETILSYSNFQYRTDYSNNGPYEYTLGYKQVGDVKIPKLHCKRNGPVLVNYYY